MDKVISILSRILQCTLLACCLTSIAYAAPIATVIIATGECSAISGGSKRTLTRGADIFQGEKLVTAKASNLQIRFTDNGLVAIKPNSEYTVDSYQLKTPNQEGKYAATLAKGQLRALTGLIGKENPKNYSLKTKISTISISGTTFSVRTDVKTGENPDDRADVMYVEEDKATIDNGFGSIEVPAGKTGVAPEGQAPFLVDGQLSVINGSDDDEDEATADDIADAIDEALNDLEIQETVEDTMDRALTDDEDFLVTEGIEEETDVLEEEGIIDDEGNGVEFPV